MSSNFITKLVLSNFRNFLSKKLEFSKQLILLHGPNGVGKTNILEALTLTGKGTAVRKSEFEDMIFCDDDNQQQQFSIFCQLQDHEFIETIAVSYDQKNKKKNMQINGEDLNNKRQNDVKNYLINFITLTPQLEQLFISGKSARRDYLDKIVCDIDLNHNSRLNNYQKLLRERLLILQKYKFANDKSSQEKWLNIIENQIVEAGVAIASARVESLDFFNKAILTFSSNFPKPKLKVIGEVEEMIGRVTSVEIEESYKQVLKDNRAYDMDNFKTKFGVHRCDFDAIFTEKNASALRSSTGEQKSIMIGITLARAKISNNYKNQPTAIIFDEIVAHLDDKKQNDLFDELKDSKLQSFFSATAKDLLPKSYLNDQSLQTIKI